MLKAILPGALAHRASLRRPTPLAIACCLWFVGPAVAQVGQGSITSLSSLTSITGGAANPVALSAPLQDTSSVIGSATKFFYPNVFLSQTGVGLSQKFNRLQIGIEALSSSDIIAGQPNQTTASWVSTTYNVGTMAAAQIAVTSAIGAAAISAAARTSDFRTWAGSSTGGPGVVAVTGVNDDAIGSAIMCVICTYGFQTRDGGVVLSQFDSNNSATPITPTPHNGVVGGATFPLGLTAGAIASTPTNSTAAMYIGSGGHGGKFEVGQIILENALDTANGGGGGGVAYRFPTGASLQWMSTGNASQGEIWGDANGINLNKVAVLTGGSTPGTPASATGYLWGATSNGLTALGKGSTNDFTLLNSAGAVVFRVPTGTTTINAQAIQANSTISYPGVATGTPSASLCIDASNNVIKKTTAGSCI